MSVQVQFSSSSSIYCSKQIIHIYACKHATIWKILTSDNEAIRLSLSCHIIYPDTR